MNNDSLKSLRVAGLPQLGRPDIPGTSRWRKLAGFTLMELMIVVAVVALLAVIALPAYQGQVQKSRRATAKVALLDLAAREEKFYSLQNTYTNDPAALYNGPFPSVPGGGVTYYNLTVATSTPPAPQGGFQATATRAPGGGQSKDVCGDYQVDSLGNQSLQNNTAAISACW